MNINTEKFDSIVSKKESRWHKNEDIRVEDKVWKALASKISIKILLHLRETKTTQTDLARMMGVSRQYISKILQGKENLGLSTICRLEEILQLQLIEVVGYSETLDYPTSKSGSDNIIIEATDKFSFVCSYQNNFNGIKGIA